MKKNKKNYGIIAALTLVTVIASCKKESIEPVAPSTLTPVAEQQTAPNPQDEPTSERNTGAALLSEMEYNKLPKAPDEISALALPSSFYLQCPPVRNQGSEGSCTAFGTAYAARSITAYYRYNTGFYDDGINVYSPEYVYNQTKIGSNCSGGAYVTSALNLMKNGNGVCRWNTMPYSSTNGCSTMPSSYQIQSGNMHRIQSYATVARNTTAIKNQLVLNRPVIVAGHVDTEFQSMGYNLVYSQYNSSHFVGNHCYCVIGYSDSKNAFKIYNSWGTGWGTSGYAWIDYSLVSSMFSEAYIMTSY